MKPYCSGHSSITEEIAARQINAIVGLVYLKRKREREGRAKCVAILSEGIAVALYAWDPMILKVH